jgi:hypothetical protein
MLPLRGKSSVISSDNDFFAGAAAPPGPQRSWSSPGLFERPKSPHFGLLDEWCGRPESETPQLVVGQSAVSSRRKRGSTAPVLLLTLGQLHSELAHATLVPLQIVRASLSGGTLDQGIMGIQVSEVETAEAAAMPHGPRSDVEPAGSSGRSLRVDSGKEPVYLPRDIASWQHCERVRRKR